MFVCVSRMWHGLGKLKQAPQTAALLQGESTHALSKRNLLKGRYELGNGNVQLPVPMIAKEKGMKSSEQAVPGFTGGVTQGMAEDGAFEHVWIGWHLLAVNDVKRVGFGCVPPQFAAQVIEWHGNEALLP